MLNRFLSKTIAFSIPIIMLVLPALLLLKNTGENFTSLKSVIQNEEKALVGYFYNEPKIKYLKWKTIQKRNRMDIVALGSSRVLQFREEMFDAAFYNAGFTISRTNRFINWGPGSLKHR